jgi:hypothetical protein
MSSNARESCFHRSKIAPESPVAMCFAPFNHEGVGFLAFFWS